MNWLSHTSASWLNFVYHSQETPSLFKKSWARLPSRMDEGQESRINRLLLIFQYFPWYLVFSGPSQHIKNQRISWANPPSSCRLQGTLIRPEAKHKMFWISLRIRSSPALDRIPYTGVLRFLDETQGLTWWKSGKKYGTHGIFLEL